MSGYDKNAIFKVLILSDLAMMALYVLTHAVIPIPSWTIRHWFDMDAELNVQTWYSTIQLFFIALVAVACYRVNSDKRLKRGCMLIAAGFAFLSADEAARIHEGIAHIAAKTQLASEYFSSLPQLWMFIYPIVGIALLVLFRHEIAAFLQAAEGTRIFLGGVVVYGLGTLGFEAMDLYLIPGTLQERHFIEVCFEETFEILGQSIMCYGLLTKLEAMSLAPGRQDGSFEGITERAISLRKNAARGTARPRAE